MSWISIHHVDTVAYFNSHLPMINNSRWFIILWTFFTIKVPLSKHINLIQKHTDLEKQCIFTWSWTIQASECTVACKPKYNQWGLYNVSSGLMCLYSCLKSSEQIWSKYFLVMTFCLPSLMMSYFFRRFLLYERIEWVKSKEKWLFSLFCMSAVLLFHSLSVALNGAR